MFNLQEDIFSNDNLIIFQTYSTFHGKPVKGSPHENLPNFILIAKCCLCLYNLSYSL